LTPDEGRVKSFGSDGNGMETDKKKAIINSATAEKRLERTTSARLLREEIKLRSKKNVVQGQLFSKQLKKTLNAYHNRAIATQEVIEELVRLAKDLEAATRRGEDLGLNEEEIAFYDALAANDSAKQAMGDDKLKVIAGELIRQVRTSVTIDWQYREGARAKIRVLVKRILNRYGYPPDLQEEAVKLVLRQTELLCADWV
jgi:type I restriction enzyme R subunit